VASPAVGLGALAVLVAVVLCDELIFRAVVQRALQDHFGRPALACVMDVAVATLASSVQGASMLAVVATHALPAMVWALTRRTWACLLVRLCAVAFLAVSAAAPL